MVISDIIHKSTTYKKITSKNLRLKEWMTAGSLSSTRHKQSLALKCKKHPNNKKLTIYYKKYKNKYTQILRLAKKKFYEYKFKTISNNPKLTWQLINEITCSKNINKDTIKTIIHKGQQYDTDNDPTVVSNIFNKFFINIGKKLAEKANNVPKNEFVNASNNFSFDNSFSERIVNSEVINIVKNFKDDTAAGHDRITCKLLKYIIKLVADPLVHIFNLSIQQGIFPDNLKLAVIKPIYKAGDKKNINNYRPISLINNFSKIFEKIIKQRLISFLESNKLLSKNQYGFRPGIGTENALYHTTQFIYRELDYSNKVIAVFLDLTKAFDTVNHNILFQIFPNFGINNQSFNWFKSYLTNRQQMVKISDITGQVGSVEYGVPQGSVLGPILFLLYINAVSDLIIDGLVVSYADDTCLLFTDKTWNGVHHKATVGLNNIYRILCNRNLTLNENKTMFMTFSIYKSFPTLNHIKIHRCIDGKSCTDLNGCLTIKEVSSTRYLGIIFDRNLRWNLHIQNLVGKLRQLTYKFYKLKDLIPKYTMRVVYFALYQSILQYGLLIWGGSADCFLNQLQINQNNIVRVCLNKFSLSGSTSHNYRELGVLPVKLLFKKFAVLFTIKNFNKGLVGQDISDKRENRRYNIPIDYPCKSFGQSFISYLGPVFFNSMPCQFKKDIQLSQKNAKKLVYNWLFSLIN